MVVEKGSDTHKLIKNYTRGNSRVAESTLIAFGRPERVECVKHVLLAE